MCESSIQEFRNDLEHLLNLLGLSQWAATWKLYFTECEAVHFWSPDLPLPGLTLAGSSLGLEENR
jgi:hypothetical protein